MNPEPRAEDRFVQLNAWFIRMRWLACVVSTVLIVATVEVFKYLDRETFWPLLTLVIILVATNGMYLALLKRRWLLGRLSEIQIGADLLILTAMLHCSGGIENPLSLVYLFHVIIGGVLFERRKCYLIVGVASVLFSAMALAEMLDLAEHYTLLVFPHPRQDGSEELFHAADQPIYVLSIVLLQALFMSLTAYFTTSITERLRAEERQALAHRQRLERVLQASGAGLLVLDRDLRPVWLNDQIRTWLAVSHSGSQALDHWTGGSEGPGAKTLQDGLVRVVERQLGDGRGGTRFFQVTIAPLSDTEGRPYQVVE